MVETVSIFIGFFLGMVLMYILIKFRTRHDGQIVITQGLDGKKTFLLEVDIDPAQISEMDSVSFKVVDEPSSGYDEVAD